MGAMNQWVGFVGENLQGTMYFGKLLFFYQPHVDLVPIIFSSNFLSQDIVRCPNLSPDHRF